MFWLAKCVRACIHLHFHSLKIKGLKISITKNIVQHLHEPLPVPRSPVKNEIKKMKCGSSAVNCETSALNCGTFAVWIAPTAELPQLVPATAEVPQLTSTMLRELHGSPSLAHRCARSWQWQVQRWNFHSCRYQLRKFRSWRDSNCRGSAVKYGSSAVNCGSSAFYFWSSRAARPLRGYIITALASATVVFIPPHSQHFGKVTTSDRL